MRRAPTERGTLIPCRQPGLKIWASRFNPGRTVVVLHKEKIAVALRSAAASEFISETEDQFDGYHLAHGRSRNRADPENQDRDVHPGGQGAGSSSAQPQDNELDNNGKCVPASEHGS